MQKKERKIKALFSDNNYLLYLDFVKSTNWPHVIRQSNYTLEIESDFLHIQFMQSLMSKSALIANKMIIRDIKQKGLLPPDINKDDLDYFSFSPPQRLKKTKSTIYNIDIKSAYATVLKNHGVISEQTENYMRRLQKKDRLASIGMLAGKKNEFHYNEKNEVVNLVFKENDLQNFFYFCVWKVQQIMNKCREIAGNSFLFYWVDGIYFDKKDCIDKISDYLSEHNYAHSTDELHEFTFTDTANRYNLHFFKDGEKKTFPIPKPNAEINKKIIALLSLHDDDTHDSLYTMFSETEIIFSPINK